MKHTHSSVVPLFLLWKRDALHCVLVHGPEGYETQLLDGKSVVKTERVRSAREGMTLAAAWQATSRRLDACGHRMHQLRS
jgi:hypothetical protein